jgi:hypothetical protein
MPTAAHASTNTAHSARIACRPPCPTAHADVRFRALFSYWVGDRGAVARWHRPRSRTADATPLRTFGTRPAPDSCDRRREHALPCARGQLRAPLRERRTPNSSCLGKRPPPATPRDATAAWCGISRFSPSFSDAGGTCAARKGGAHRSICGSSPCGDGAVGFAGVQSVTMSSGYSVSPGLACEARNLHDIHH